MIRRYADLLPHLIRFVLTLVLLAWAPAWPLRAACALALFFCSFTAAHDLAHGALGLSRRSNGALLTFFGVAMLTSGHAMRRMHMRHHARPLSEGDIEGEGARRSLLGALLLGPANALAVRVSALRSAPDKERRAQIAETLLGLALAAALVRFGGAGLRTYVAVTLLMQLTASLWASHIPHRLPEEIIRLAASLSFLRSPAILSLAFHDAHHAHPKVPAHRLAELRAHRPRLAR